MRVTGLVILVFALATGQCETPGPPVPEAGVRWIDIGSPGDEGAIVTGLYQREGPNRTSANAWFRTHTFRWASNRFIIRLPVFAGQDNQVAFHALAGQRRFRVRAGAWELTLKAPRPDNVRQFTLPAAAVGNAHSVAVAFEAIDRYVAPPGARDHRELTAALDWISVRATRPVEEKIADIGAKGDDRFVVSGLYQREGPYPNTRVTMARNGTFRWARERFALRLPVFPRRRTAMDFHMSLPPERVTIRVDQWQTRLYGGGEHHLLVLPADVVGDREEVTIHFELLPRPAKTGTAAKRDARTLVAMVDWVRIRPAQAEDKMPELKPFPPTPTSVRVIDRLRGVENRPPKANVEAFVAMLKDGGANVVTISPTNGQVVASFPSRYAVRRDDMDPNWIPDVIRALRRERIAIIFWMPFNVQDLRNPDDFAPAKQFPQWRMKFIEDPAPKRKVGMCIQSSPYREHHRKFLQECAVFDIDAMWFDGYYLGGIPHPAAPGCVCRWCGRRFKQATGLDLPRAVDWNDMTFKRWVRWRNTDLLAATRYFIDGVHDVKPGLPVTANTNLWPFGNKDWETGIPMWRIDDLGVSQHAYSGKPGLEWVMLGYKSRLSHDMNPAHADIWRTSRPSFPYTGTPEDIARHEEDMSTFVLSALSHGVAPWHGGHIAPFAVENRVHHMLAERERFFSRDNVTHVGVWLSQDTHDFWGHIPGTDHLVDYQDSLLGAWSILSRSHIPFDFIFDNTVTRSELDRHSVLWAPNTAAISQQRVDAVLQWVRDGGWLILSGVVGDHDEWGRPLARSRFVDWIADGERDVEVPLGRGRLVYLRDDPGLAYVRRRDEEAVRALLAKLSERPAPVRVETGPEVIVNAFHSPDGKQLWVHLLNISAYLVDGDTGFRGLHEAAAFPDGKSLPHRRHVVRNITIHTPGFRITAAGLGVSGKSLPIDANGAVTVPALDRHEVVVFSLS